MVNSFTVTKINWEREVYNPWVGIVTQWLMTAKLIQVHHHRNKTFPDIAVTQFITLKVKL